jgi:hypothetical protein
VQHDDGRSLAGQEHVNGCAPILDLQSSDPLGEWLDWHVSSKSGRQRHVDEPADYQARPQ